MDRHRLTMTGQLVEIMRERPQEGRDPINNAAQGIVRAMQEMTGQAWLGKFNRLTPQDLERPLLYQWNGAPVPFESADFVLPACSIDIVDQMREREAYGADPVHWRPERDKVLLRKLYQTVADAGGVVLNWQREVRLK